MALWVGTPKIVALCALYLHLTIAVPVGEPDQPSLSEERGSLNQTLVQSSMELELDRQIPRMMGVRHGEQSTPSSPPAGLTDNEYHLCDVTCCCKRTNGFWERNKCVSMKMADNFDIRANEKLCDCVLNGTPESKPEDEKKRKICCKMGSRFSKGGRQIVWRSTPESKKCEEVFEDSGKPVTPFDFTDDVDHLHSDAFDAFEDSGQPVTSGCDLDLYQRNAIGELQRLWSQGTQQAQSHESSSHELNSRAPPPAPAKKRHSV